MSKKIPKIKTQSNLWDREPREVIEEWVAYTMEYYFKVGDPILKMGTDVVRKMLRTRYAKIAQETDNKFHDLFKRGVWKPGQVAERIAVENPDIEEPEPNIVKIDEDELLDRLSDKDLLK